MHVLIVGDEVQLAETVRGCLVAEGFNVDMVHNGVDGLRKAKENPYDVIVLDIRLPEMSGYSVCEQLRADGVWTPILMLTAKDGEYDQADALDLGADDYLTKPFSFIVLVAHLRALVRRGAPERPVLPTARDLGLDPAHRRVERGGLKDPSPTTRKFGLPEFLVSRAGAARAFSLGALAALIAFSLFGLVFSAVLDNVLDGNGISALDDPVLQWLVTHRGDEMTILMQVVTALGGPVVLPIVALVGILATRALTRSWNYAVLIGITAAGSTLITVAAKTIVGRSRPPLESAITAETGYAFPSGHSLNSMTIYGVLALVAILATNVWSGRVWITLSATTLVALVGLSRLYLGVHWLTDVLGAWMLGGAWLTAVTFVWWYTVRPRGSIRGRPISAPTDG